jgi:DNA-directed RNA polymerase subunit F
MSRPCYYYDLRAGPIEGLNLPYATWVVLRRENITTLDQLRTVADHLEQVVGIGPKTARMIREELARVVPSKNRLRTRDST